MKLRKPSVIAVVASLVASTMASMVWSPGAANATLIDLAFNTSCTAANSAATPLVVGTNCRTVFVGGRLRQYIVVVPPNGALSDPHDVVFVFHGTGGDGGDFSRQPNGWVDLGATSAANFITVFPTATRTYVCGDGPCGYANRFNGYGSTPTATPTIANPVGVDPAVVNPSAPVDDIAFFDEMLRDLGNTAATGVGVNTNRVFTAGFSSGACMALTLVYERSIHVTAAAVVAGCAPERLVRAPVNYRPISYSIGANDPAAFGTGGSMTLNPIAAVLTPFGVSVFQGLAYKSGRALTERRALQWPAITALAASNPAGVAAQYPLLAPLVPAPVEQTWIWWKTPRSAVADEVTVEVMIVAGAGHEYSLGQGVSPAAIGWTFFERKVPR